MKMKLPKVRTASFEMWSVIRFLGMNGETPSSIHAEITGVYSGDVGGGGWPWKNKKIPTHEKLGKKSWKNEKR